ncbi:hypothetical protein [Pseudomonas putida]|uniref:hypothetical protein n=1 Tax=Pseudomonas putida TaxID=303 RepID=UPI0012603526|nr:hypothetical protein [Pseudomonas putida]
MDLKDEIMLEKYKYILSQKQALNEATFKIVAVYQALVLALAAGQYTVLTTYENAPLKPVWALSVTYMLLGMYVTVSLLIVALLVGGIFSWKGYRKDESVIELQVYGVGKESIKLKSVWCWYETYLVLFVVVASGVGVFSYFACILPVFKM